jgi:CDP-diacylglycerol--serine O-phosphatidyltransferase
MKRSVIVPNIITAFSLSCGLFVIFKMSSLPAGQVSYEQAQAAVLIVMLAAVLDLLDGAIARAMKVESEFGGVFDSLADAVSFGVAPSVIILKTLSVAPQTMLSFFLTTSAMIYSISGVLRLVRFTVNKKVKEDIKELALAKANFTGLPIPASAAVALSTTLFLMTPEANELFGLSLIGRAYVATALFVLLAYFMISRWKFPSLKSVQVRLSTFQIVLITGFIAAVILLCLPQHFAALLVGIFWSYLLVAWGLAITRIVAGRKNKALEDFEPESEDEDKDEG